MNNPHRQTIFIVDDDAAVRDSLSLFLSLQGYTTALFACAEDFLGALNSAWRGVVIADIRMPGLSGLEMQEALASHPASMPVIIITGHGDLTAARRAFKFEAIDFLEKPFEHERLLKAVEQAMHALRVRTAQLGSRPEASTLSRREREVMALVVQGMDNGSIGRELGISPRTVEVHKSRIMSKLGTRNLAELIRVSQALASRR